MQLANEDYDFGSSQNGAVELFYDNESKKLETTSDRSYYNRSVICHNQIILN